MEEDDMTWEKPALPAHSRAYDETWPSSDGSGAFIPSYLLGTPYHNQLQLARERKAKKDRATERIKLQSIRREHDGASKATSSSNDRHAVPITPEHFAAADDDVPALPSLWMPNVVDLREVHFERNPFTLALEAGGTARATTRVPPLCGLYYFEVQIMECMTEQLSFAIGLATKDADLMKPTAHQLDAWSYCADDVAEHNNHPGRAWGQRLEKNDTLGCGIIFRENTVFFTKNGYRLDHSFKTVTRRELYPVISFFSPAGLQVQTNWGQRPFTFDINWVMNNQRKVVEQSLQKYVLGDLAPDGTEDADVLMETIILQVLQRDGYAEPARLFAEEVKTQRRHLNPKDRVQRAESDAVLEQGVRHRQSIRQAILGGDVDKALDLTTEYYPDVLRYNEHVHFRLRCQRFIEMIRVSAQLREKISHDVVPRDTKRVQSLNKAERGDENSALHRRLDQSDQAMLAYGRSVWADYSKDTRPEFFEMLKDISPLLAQVNPARASQSRHLMAEEQRVAVWDALNSAIMLSLGEPRRSAMETMIAQTKVLLNSVRNDGGDACFVSVEDAAREVHLRRQ